MKKLFSVVLCALIVISLSACGSDKKTKEIDLAAFTKQVVEQVKYDDELIPLGEKVAPDFYDLSFAGLEGWSAYISGSMSTANELMIMKLKDDAAIESAKKSVQKRIDDQIANYKNYRPDELFRLENAVVEVQGNYLLFSASGDNDTVKKLFEEALK